MVWGLIASGQDKVTIYGGSNEIQKNIISERVLKMPKEPRFDTDRPFRDVPKNVV